MTAGQRKIAIFLATSGHSGVDRVMSNLITEIAGRGIAVDLLRIRNHGPHFAKVPANVRLVDLGTSHVNSSFPALVRYLRRERPQALLSDKDRLNRLAIVARGLAGVPTRLAVRMGTTVSENLAKRSWFDRNMQYFSIRCLYPRADVVLVPSRGAAEDIVNIGRLNPARVKVVPSPIVNDRLDRMAAEKTDHPWLIEESAPVILGVGELCERKDFGTLIKAFARLRKSREARLIILGEGKKREELRALARELGVAKDVDLPGFTANPYAFMARASLFVLSSRCEGAPVVLMEALACGTPAVSTDCPSGPREILQNGELGGLVPVGDEEALAAAMAQTLSTPPARQTLRDGARPYRVAASADTYLKALEVAHD
jgi:glycosyltransferase involved in cell wall biosynthesis